MSQAFNSLLLTCPRIRRWRGLSILLAFTALGFSPAALAVETLVITEFLASNATGLQDEDGDRGDWIEIHNPASAPVSLEGWSLTDDARILRRWTFPAVTIAGNGFLLVFASGKDRSDPARELHTSFSLDRDGEYLALVRPDESISAAFAPAFPPQVPDVSYGLRITTQSDLFVAADAAGRFLSPADQIPEAGWVQLDHDDSTWSSIRMGVGYDRIPPGETDPSEPVPPSSDVTAPGDPVTATSSNSPGGEDVTMAIDNNPGTKYLNFDKLNAGLTVRPLKGPSIVTGLRLTSANDAPERDPASFILSGANDGQNFVEIARGGIPDFPSRFAPVEIAFSNSVAFTHYRLIFPTVRDAASANSVQIAEIEFLGEITSSAPAFAELLQTRVETAMYGRASSAYLRLPFHVDELRPLENFALRLRYDDGFAAWLNGTFIASGNAPSTLAHDRTALTNRFRRDAVQEAVFDLGALAHLLKAGTNLLAIQGFNDRPDSPDFLIEARLENRRFVLGEAGYFETPTPAIENSSGSAGLVTGLAFSASRGFYDSPFDLVISSPTDGVTVRYTTDGTLPTLGNGLTYTAPLPIHRTTIFRAAGFRDGWIASAPQSHTYLFTADVAAQTQSSAIAAGFPSMWGSQPADYGLDPRVIGGTAPDNFGGKYARTFENDLKSIPSMSLIAGMEDMFGPQGIYANPLGRGDAWERPVSVELIYPDGRPGFQQDAGIRIQGGAFRRFDLSLKKSFRVIFRDRYGADRLQFPLFGPGAVASFKNFVLRANSNDAWPYGGSSALYIRDAFAMQSMREMGQAASHSAFVHLYINGQYWGLYNPTERPDAAFLSSYYGGQSDSWDAINQDSAPDGNYDAWNRLMAALNQDVSRTDAYQRLQGNNFNGSRNPAYENLIDVENMIDYMILNFYVGNVDWPHRNWWTGRDRNDGAGFKFHPWDTETALGFSSVSHDNTGVNSAVARPYAALRANADFRLHFADRVYRHFSEGGVFYVNPASPAWNQATPENNRPAARFSALAESIRSAIVGESARWGDQLRSQPYTRDEHWQASLNNLIATYFPRRSSNIVEHFRVAGLYSDFDPPVMNQRGGTVEPGFQLTLSSPIGGVYYTLDGSDPRRFGRPYSSPIVLRDLVTVKARVRNGQVWSALNEASFVAGRPSLVLTELHYHPLDPSPAEQADGFLDANDFEYLELFNDGTASFNLAGAAFVTGIQFDFAQSSVTRLAPGEFLLLVQNRAAFERRYGAGLPVAGHYSGRLSNSGERVVLLDSTGEPLLDFTYATRNPWPRTPDGMGPSLEVLHPNGSLNDPANWRASFHPGGSPGRTNPLPPLNLDLTTAAGGALSISFDAPAGTGYTLYASDSVTDRPWEIVERAEPLSEPRRVELILDTATHPRTRFFRVSLP